MMKILNLVVIFVLVVIIGLSVWLVSGQYSVGADTQHWRITEYVLGFVRDSSVSRVSRDVIIPNDLGDESNIKQGAGNYDEMCSSCHLKPGIQSSEMFAGLYPAPPVFKLEGIDDEQRAFWIIKHGLKMTGMPAWGASHSDNDIWALVSFLLVLPDLNQERYLELVSMSQGHSHGDGEGHDDTGGEERSNEHNELKPYSKIQKQPMLEESHSDDDHNHDH